MLGGASANQHDVLLFETIADALELFCDICKHNPFARLLGRAEIEQHRVIIEPVEGKLVDGTRSLSVVRRSEMIRRINMRAGMRVCIHDVHRAKVNDFRHGHAQALGPKAAAERYAAFLDMAPGLIAREARSLDGAARRRALDAYARARETSRLAPRLSLDPSATVFQLGTILASVAAPQPRG